jgi:hypothetical protein
MKKVFLVLSSLAITSICKAQWSGTNPLYTSSTQSVGVGLSNPSQLFEVNGNVAIKGTHLVFNSQHGVIDWGSGGFGDLYFRRINNGAIGTYIDLAHFKYNGNLAIGGGFDPQAKLHVLADATRAGIRVDLNGVYGSYLSIHHSGGGSIIDPIGTGILFLGYDQGTDVRIGGNYGNGTNPYSKLGIGVPSNSNIAAFAHIQTPDVAWHGLLLDHRSTTACVGEEIRIRNAGSKAFVVSSYTNAASPTDVFRVWGDGKVWCTEVNVQLTPFPDYVFQKDYRLMSLESLDDYIKENHHLPNVPSANDIENNGANLGELCKIQMEKIEELTLYIIEMKKEIESLKKKDNQ